MGKKRQRKQQVSKGITHQNPNRLGNRIRKLCVFPIKVLTLIQLIK